MFIYFSNTCQKKLCLVSYSKVQKAIIIVSLNKLMAFKFLSNCDGLALTLVEHNTVTIKFECKVNLI